MSGYYLHRKTGGIYRVVGWERIRQGVAEGESVFPLMGTGDIELIHGPFTVTDSVPPGELAVFYVNALTGQRWVRPHDMFHDGRFTAFENPPALLTRPAPVEEVTG